MKGIFAVLVFLVIVISGCVTDYFGTACDPCVETYSCVVPETADIINNYCDMEYQELAEPQIIEKGCCSSGYPNKLTKIVVNITPKNESVRRECPTGASLYVDEFGNYVLCRVLH